jgi:hypothetical protein
MPMHDWSKVEPSKYHAMHYEWISQILKLLNSGLLPEEFYALPETRFGKREGDAVTLQIDEINEELWDQRVEKQQIQSAAILAPRTSTVSLKDHEHYGRKTNRIAIRNERERIVAVIELVSSGNKSSRAEIKKFITKAHKLLEKDIHLLVIDPFPPTKRDPDGLHPLIWEDCTSEAFHLPLNKKLSAAAYDSEEMTAYVEPFAVGDELPTMPLFLASPYYINLPLETAYMRSWNELPTALQKIVLAAGQSSL